MERRRAAGPVADRDEVRAIDLGDRQHRVAVEDPEAGRLVRQARQPLELRQRDPAQVERPLGPFGEADDDQPEAVLAGLVVLLDETALLERGQQARGRRLVQPEPTGELRDAGLALAVAEGEQERRGPVDRSDGVPVEDHPARAVQPAPGCDIAPVGSGAISPWARASSAASSESEKIVTTRSTMSPSACASQMNHGSRESGSGIAPRACIPTAIASYSSWSVVAQSRYSDASTSRT